jgi:hypothetical protein
VLIESESPRSDTGLDVGVGTRKIAFAKMKSRTRVKMDG